VPRDTPARSATVLIVALATKSAPLFFQYNRKAEEISIGGRRFSGFSTAFCASCAVLCFFVVCFANNVVQIFQKNGQKYVKKVSFSVFCSRFEKKSLKKPFHTSTMLTQFFSIVFCEHIADIFWFFRC